MTQINYADRETKEVFTPVVLSMKGIDTENAQQMQRLNLVPVHYAYPTYDTELYRIVPKNGLTEVEGGFVQEFDVVDRDIADARNAMKERVTAERWKVETGGIVLNGTEILTGIEDQNRIATSLSGMIDAGIESVNFKAASGWEVVSQKELKAIKIAIALHVEACFDHEREFHDAIDRCTTVAELATLDVTKGWPERDKTATVA